MSEEGTARPADAREPERVVGAASATPTAARLVVIGLSHRTAPVEVRERAAVADGKLDDATRRAAALAAAEGPGEALLVSTCNRVELYLSAFGDDRDAAARGQAVAEQLLGEIAALDPGVVRPHLYSLAGEAAVRHLFRVAASLDSMVVGEPQILGQVKDAWEAAGRAGTVGPMLGRVLPRAFAAAKRVRTETEIGRSSASIASAAVSLARHIFGELAGKEVLVIGAGKMGGLAARHFSSAGAGPLSVVNRTLSRAEDLARTIGGQPHPWSALEALLARADVVLSSTGAAQPVLRRELIQRVMKARKGRWLCLIDIAVPRDVEPGAGDIDNVYLYDVDALQTLTDETLAERRRAADEGERIVSDEVARFVQSERSLGVVPTIRALRERFLEVARAEAERSAGRLGAAERERKEIDALADAIVNKLLHAPLTALKRDPDSDALVQAARRLFGLDGEEPKRGGKR